MTVQDSHLISSEPSEVELEVGGYRLRGNPRRREGGSLLFDALDQDGDPVAVQMTAEPLVGRRSRARFRKLARARSQLRHPALLPVRTFGEDRGRIYVVTERRPPGSLAERLRPGPLDPELALRLLRSAAEGLTAGHEAGLVHLALGAESLLLDGERLQLDLFGLFRAWGQAGWGDVVRRDPYLRYESPEGIRGEELSPASNVYSLTALLVHVLTGAPPFAYKDPMLIEHAHLSEAPPRPSERDAGLSPALDEVVARGMAKDPSERPATPMELMAEAARALGGGVSRGAVPQPLQRGAPPAPRRDAALPPQRGAAAEPTPPPQPEPAPERQAAEAAPPGGASTATPTAPPGSARTVLDAWLAASAAAPAESAAPAAASEPDLPKAGRQPSAAPSPPPKAPPTMAPWESGGVVAAPAQAPDVLKPPISVRLRQLLPVFAVVVVAAGFGAIVGLPGSSTDPAPRAAPSPDARTVARLDEVRVRLRDDLAAAATPAEQASAAERLADAHSTAAAAARSPELKGAAENAVSAYTALATAARNGDEDAFSAATADVETADDVLARALRSR